MKKRVLWLFFSCLLIASLTLLPACTVKYALDTSVTPANAGTVKPVGVSYQGENTGVPSPSKSDAFNEGARVTLAATPAADYRFDHWSGDASGSSDKAEVLMDTEKAVTAHFVAQYSLDASVWLEGGTITPVSGIYDAGTSVTIEATPDSHWNFYHWSGDISDTSDTITVTMNSDMEITAVFIYQYELITSVTGGAGTVTPAGGYFDDDSIVTLTATPAAGYRFHHWSGDASGTSETTTIEVQCGDMEVTAHFMPTGPANVVASMNDPVNCQASGENECTWRYLVTFTETNGVGVTIETIGRRYIDVHGNVWISEDGEWSLKHITIAPSGSAEYSSWVRSINDSSGDLRGGTVVISYQGHDDNGNAISGKITAKLAPEP